MRVQSIKAAITNAISFKKDEPKPEVTTVKQNKVLPPTIPAEKEPTLTNWQAYALYGHYPQYVSFRGCPPRY